MRHMGLIKDIGADTSEIPKRPRWVSRNILIGEGGRGLYVPIKLFHN